GGSLCMYMWQLQDVTPWYFPNIFVVRMCPLTCIFRLLIATSNIYHLDSASKHKVTMFHIDKEPNIRKMDNNKIVLAANPIAILKHFYHIIKAQGHNVS
ncbi:hypothetical protein ACJX0J_023154, partial [Zea mays]